MKDLLMSVSTTLVCLKLTSILSFFATLAPRKFPVTRTKLKKRKLQRITIWLQYNHHATICKHMKCTLQQAHSYVKTQQRVT